jgi:hypothetical protein
MFVDNALGLLTFRSQLAQESGGEKTGSRGP